MFVRKPQRAAGARSAAGPSGPKNARISVSDPPVKAPRIKLDCRSAGMLLAANILLICIFHAPKVIFLSSRLYCGRSPILRLS